MSSPAYTIEVVDRALSVLLMFRTQTTLRVTEVSQELDIAPSSAHRLLSTLRARGFVIQDRVTKSYRLGPSMLQLGASIADRPLIRSIVHPVLIDLADRFRETSQLAALTGTDIRFFDSVECTQPVRVASRLGEALPAHATAVGKVLLAAQSDAEVAALVGAKLRAVTDATLVDRDLFFEELDEVRRLGYAINRGESLQGVRAVAVPVVDLAERTVAAVAISVPAERGPIAKLKSFVPYMREAMEAIKPELSLASTLM
jgi:DNA-binding IclR family transcriptional regulator